MQYYKYDYVLKVQNLKLYYMIIKHNITLACILALLLVSCLDNDKYPELYPTMGTVSSLDNYSICSDSYGKLIPDNPDLISKNNADSIGQRVLLNINFPKENIHTGEDMYKEIQQKLLGREKDRKEIKEYEMFLSKNFFENKPINLIPNIITNYMYINIDGEEYELHNLGEGIKQLVIITYKMFMQKNKFSLFFIEEPELNLHPRTSKKINRVNVK